ncbi:Arp2/3 complex, 34 kd subunit p34-Arc-domain-containing protein [Phakopsora pachyrhizi]|uniref:Arp2/3 complex 34 kDa subunit n=1 Tax=Phakopsora pachyrhizi TaxID=170000 RepID=A0AAV0B4W1_PHAPC|nr:Arp2/3 complex, 34 kd subunit p34-Arc-domain-containing protein [Phakopsora pachyrhizi]CAH7677033.1 Arp2/3 complex, 34 kd subunit p34-Arc-domain-containing protein [Phakopsora pachyrhizi]CAH7689024.1 Arp2/3 complex, 34 kd subunit p34-Arc-domain-containing protein [Phakopsora pachyrhizi]
MILLEDHNRIIQDVLTEKFEKPGSLDQAFVDFDGVRYHLSTPEKKSIILLSMAVRCWPQLESYGVWDIMRREYGDWICKDVESDHDISLIFEIGKIPTDPVERVNLIRSVALLKRNALATPFERAFSIQKTLESNPPKPDDPIRDPNQDLMALNYRPEEAIYVIPNFDRVTVVFSTVFREDTDMVYGKVFLQEFVDARRRPAIQTAPQILYSNREPPREINHIQGLTASENMGYVTFVLFPRHFSTPEAAFSTISRIQLFRDYLHYHIKASKAYIHSRMRARTNEFLKILNRAKPEVLDKERKTASGRKFIRG